MPTYEYECQKCGEQFEVFQAIADKPLKVCPKEKCARKTWGKGKVKRLIGSGAGLLFKGSGFYITDYRSENYKQAAKKETEGTKSSSSSSSSTEGKASGSSSSNKSSQSGSKSESKSPGSHNKKD